MVAAQLAVAPLLIRGKQLSGGEMVLQVDSSQLALPLPDLRSEGRQNSGRYLPLGELSIQFQFCSYELLADRDSLALHRLIEPADALCLVGG
jgi:hypothetical protein